MVEKQHKYSYVAVTNYKEIEEGAKDEQSHKRGEDS